MATLDWHVRRTDGVTLVELLVTSERDHEIRIESNVEPVWPPRREGVPAAGWEDGVYVGRISAGERLVLGYASPGNPVEPPAQLQTGPAEGDTASSSDSPSPRELIRALGDARPPRDVVSASGPSVNDPEQASCPSPDDPTRGHSEGAPAVERSLPAMFEAWFEGIETRLSAARRPGRVESDGGEPTRGAANTGPGEPLARQLAVDREHLELLGKRQRELASRLEELEIRSGTRDST